MISLKLIDKDGNTHMPLKKDGNGQELMIKSKRVTWSELSELIQSEESPFPALSQIEVYGNNI